MDYQAYSEKGYQKKTPVQVYNELVARVKQAIPDFEEQNLDLQNDLINTSVQAIMQFENIKTFYLNSYSPDYTSDFIFNQLAESLGLKPKGEYKAQCDFIVTDSKGTIIPRNLKIQMENGVIFETTDSVVIGESGSAYVTGYADTEEVSEPNTTKGFITIFSDTATITNPTSSFAKVGQESFSQLKARAQAKLRAIRKGGSEYAEVILTSLEGIESRLVNFFVREIVSEERDDLGNPVRVVTQGVEAVIGGGDPNKIALALFKAFMETQKLISQPSSNEAGRTITQELTYYGNVIPIVFTRPKGLQFKLRIKFTTLGVSITAESITANASEIIAAYLNTKKVGEPLTKTELRNLLIPILQRLDIPLSSVKQLDFQYSVIAPFTDFKEFNQDERVDELQFDCYLMYAGLEVVLNG